MYSCWMRIWRGLRSSIMQDYERMEGEKTKLLIEKEKQKVVEKGIIQYHSTRRTVWMLMNSCSCWNRTETPDHWSGDGQDSSRDSSIQRINGTRNKEKDGGNRRYLRTPSSHCRTECFRCNACCPRESFSRCRILYVQMKCYNSCDIDVSYR